MQPTEIMALDDLEADLREDSNSHGAVLRFSNCISTPQSLARAKLTRNNRRRLFRALVDGARIAANHQDAILEETLLECAAKIGNLDQCALKRLVAFRLARSRQDFDTARLLVLAYGNSPGPHRLDLRRMIVSLRSTDPAALERLQNLMSAFGVEPCYEPSQGAARRPLSPSKNLDGT